MLKAPLPILFFDSLVLFEDELGDNGCAMTDIKVVHAIISYHLEGYADVLFGTYAIFSSC